MSNRIEKAKSKPSYSRLESVLKVGASLLFVSSLVACSGTRPDFLGTPNLTLQACPDSPNCVSSIEDKNDAEHYVKALEVSAPAEALKAIKEKLLNTEQVEVIVAEPNYLYAEFTTDLMRFVDDLELLASKDGGQLDVRSASRLGHSDFGVNRERVEMLRTFLQENKLAE